MKRKLLDDLGIDDRWDQWYENEPEKYEKYRKEQEIYGFDSRETFSLRTSFFEWLYERLTMYKEKAKAVIDIESENAHHYVYNEKSYSLLELINMVLENVEKFLVEYRHAPTLDAEEQLFCKAMESARIFVMILPSLWW